MRIDFPPPVVSRSKPDLTGVDCNSITGAGGFGEPIADQGPNIRFCGTSAAAPHVAGILALLHEAAVADPVQSLKDSAVDLGVAGRDNIFGFGRVTAALLAIIRTPANNVTITQGQTVTFAGNCNDPAFAITDLDWDFGNGSTSSIASPPAQTYNDAGVFTVTLTCQNANGDTSVANRSVTVNAAPSGGGGGGGAVDGGGGGGGGCFIATAAYGSYLHPHVASLRQFRDTQLLTNAPGRAFVKLYYSYSPPVADVIAEHAPLRVATRVALTPVVFAVEYPRPTLGLLLAFGLLGVAARASRRREADPRRA